MADTDNTTRTDIFSTITEAWSELPLADMRAALENVSLQSVRDSWATTSRLAGESDTRLALQPMLDLPPILVDPEKFLAAFEKNPTAEGALLVATIGTMTRDAQGLMVLTALFAESLLRRVASLETELALARMGDSAPVVEF